MNEKALAQKILPRPNVTTTGNEAGALTVAGQWRNFTAFPSILAIAVVSCAAVSSSCGDVMEAASMTSTFIAGTTSDRQNAQRRVWTEHGLAERSLQEENGDPGKTRTSDKQFRKLLLYPPELRGHERCG